MFREDYLMRLIREMTEVLIRLATLHRSGDNEAALDVIDQTFEQMLGFRSALIDRLTANGLLMLLFPGGESELNREAQAKCVALAALLQKKGQLHQQLGQAEAQYTSHSKALHLLLAALNQPELTELPDYTPDVETLREALAGIILPSDTVIKLLDYYEKNGTFAKTEDLIFESLDAEENQEAILEAALAFYRRLQQLSDEQLIAGNLPRDEVEAALAELQAYQSSE